MLRSTPSSFSPSFPVVFVCGDEGSVFAPPHATMQERPTNAMPRPIELVFQRDIRFMSVLSLWYARRRRELREFVGCARHIVLALRVAMKSARALASVNHTFAARRTRRSPACRRGLRC